MNQEIIIIYLTQVRETDDIILRFGVLNNGHGWNNLDSQTFGQKRAFLCVDFAKLRLQMFGHQCCQMFVQDLTPAQRFMLSSKQCCK